MVETLGVGYVGVLGPREGVGVAFVHNEAC